MEKFCYYIDPTQDPDKYGGFVPSAVFENKPGHYPMLGKGEFASPWIWGKTLEQAEKVCKDFNNKKLNLTDEEVNQIILSSMRPLA